MENITADGFLIIKFLKSNSGKVLSGFRVIYDRVLNEKNNFEIPAFFMFKRGKSRA